MIPPIKNGITVDGRDMIPVNNFSDLERCIYQYFGENKLDWYKKTFNMDGHNGWDVWALRGADIVASHDGVVVEVSTDESAGIGVVIWDKVSLKTIYWHLKTGSVVVNVGQEVKAGDKLGLCNNTGWSTGDHLHFGIKETNEQGSSINKDNGYYGAIDPMPFFISKNNTMTWTQINTLSLLTFKRPADEGMRGYVGRDYDFVASEFLHSKENQLYTPLFEAAKVIENGIT